MTSQLHSAPNAPAYHLPNSDPAQPAALAQTMAQDASIDDEENAVSLVRTSLSPPPIITQAPPPPASTSPRPTTPTKVTSSGASSPFSNVSSPLSEHSSFTEEAPDFSPNKRQRLDEYALDAEPVFKRRHPREPLTLMDCAFDRDGEEGEGVLRLRPTAEQWADFPAIIHFAKHHGALNDGCFKVIQPDELKDPLPEDTKQNVKRNGYRPKRLKNNFWRIDTSESKESYSFSETAAEFTGSTAEALEKLKKLFGKHDGKRMRDQRYRVDVPAWTPEQRRRAGVPQRSPVHPLKGDELDFTKAIIPGIHTPYVYESSAPFGATFQIHAEDYKLISLNHLYKGRKIWVVIPSTDITTAELAFNRRDKCAQFMRHRAEFIFPSKLTQMGVPHRIIDQRPGETVVILPDAYHQGFSTGYTLAEAKNYADAEWGIEEYEPCTAQCKLKEMIPSFCMSGLGDGEERWDLCARYDDEGNLPPLPAVEATTTEVKSADVSMVEVPTGEQHSGAKRELEVEVDNGAHVGGVLEAESKRVRVE